jgi:O-methyltransferase/aklanonic acid methyltransferase
MPHIYKSSIAGQCNLPLGKIKPVRERYVSMSDAEQLSKETIANFFGNLEGPGFGLDDKFFITMGQRIADRAQIRPGSTVLDVASATGTSLFPAAEIVGETGKVIGTDLAIEMVQKTGAEIKRRGLRNVEMLHMDVETLEFADDSYDHLLSGFVLSFLPNISTTLSEFRRLLKPGGRIAVSTFDESGFPWGWFEHLLIIEGICSRMADLVSYVFQQLGTEDEMLAIFLEAGFKNIEVLDEDYEEVYSEENTWWESLLSSKDFALIQPLENETKEKSRPRHSSSFKNSKNLMGFTSDTVHSSHWRRLQHDAFIGKSQTWLWAILRQIRETKLCDTEAFNLTLDRRSHQEHP